MTIVVKLDNPNFPGNGGEVIAVNVTVAEYLAMSTDRDGARDERLRLWQSDHPVKVGERACLAHPSIGG